MTRIKRYFLHFDLEDIVYHWNPQFSLFYSEMKNSQNWKYFYLLIDPCQKVHLLCPKIAVA